MPLNPYVKDTWADFDPTKPVSAARMTNLEKQYDAAMADAAVLYGADVRPWAATTVYAAGQAVVSPSGDVVTAKTAHTSSSTFSGTGASGNWNLSTTFALPTAIPALYSSRLTYPGTGLACVGDSITANFGNNSWQSPDSYLGYAAILSAARASWRGAFGTGGYTLEQIRDTHIPSVVALSPRPAACLVGGGTNNVKTDGTGTGYVVSANIAVVQQMCDTLEAAGIRPILSTIPTRADNAQIGVNVDIYNRAIRRFANGRGYDVADFHAVLVNPATGDYKTGYGLTDQVHPSFIGTKYMGQVLASIITSRFPNVAPPLSEHILDGTNLLPNGTGMFLTDTSNVSNNTAGDGIADGWRTFGSGSIAYSITTDADGTKWQKTSLAQSATGSGNLQQTVSSAISPGDVIEVCCKVRTTGFDANFIPPTGSSTGGSGPDWQLEIDFTGATGTPTALNPAYGMHCDVPDGSIIHARGVVGAGATGGLKVSLILGGTSPTVSGVSVEFAKLAVRNLTRLGLV